MPEPSSAGGTEALAGLLVRSAAGEPEAWRELLGLYGRRVYALARSRLRRDDLAEEVAQSVFATVASKLSSGGYAEQGRFEPWLFRVTMNRVRDEVRRLRRHAEPTDPERFDHTPGAADPEPAAQPEEIDSLRAALASLGDDDREIVELRHHAGLSFKQIAQTLDEPVGTVLARHHRALRKVKQFMIDAQASGGSEPRDA